MELDDFTRHYIIAALWSSTDEQGNSFEYLNYDIGDVADETLAKMSEDCKDFQESNVELLEQAYKLYKWHPDAPQPQCSAGHDFWLTRNRHGSGFWARGFGELGDKLSDAAKLYGGVDLYVGDDGKIYSN